MTEMKTINDLHPTLIHILDLDGILAGLRYMRDTATSERDRERIVDEIMRVDAERLQLIAVWHEERYGGG